MSNSNENIIINEPKDWIKHCRGFRNYITNVEIPCIEVDYEYLKIRIPYTESCFEPCFLEYKLPLVHLAEVLKPYLKENL